MIKIEDKSKCCGCSACAERCPVQCIELCDDEQGFTYPHVNESKCVDCGLCEKVCPFLNPSSARLPQSTYSAINNDLPTRLASSSGGAFSALADMILRAGGVVFGARFGKNWEVVHDYCEKIEDLPPFRGSKYVQSLIGDNFIKAERFLKKGRLVLFTGTPCQIAGLRGYLRKDYDNLLAVDVACHGVPSPLIWNEYLQTITTAAEKISFRDKSHGWRAFHIVIDDKVDEFFNTNLYMRAFLKNLILRPSCYNCKVKCGSSMSDITIADYWGVHKISPEMYDDKGISLVICYSDKGLKFLKEANLSLGQCDYNKAIRYNSALVKSPKYPSTVDYFWRKYSTDGIDALEPAIAKVKTPLKLKAILIVKRLLGKN